MLTKIFGNKISRFVNLALIFLATLGVAIALQVNNGNADEAMDTLKSPQARVYSGLPQSPVNAKSTDKIKPAIITLPNLVKHSGEPWRLRGTQVEVVNYGVLVDKDKTTGKLRGVPMGNAEGNSFLYDPAGGGPTPRENEKSKGKENKRVLEASRFGEVNTYYHADRTLTYANNLLADIGEKSVPHLRVVVNDHYCSRLPGYGQEDCDKRGDKFRSFGGGHYRLPTVKFDEENFEHSIEEMNPTGEVHLGPGNNYIKDAKGNQVLVDGYPYNENPSHNAGIIIHETAHHIVSHTADFRENQDRKPNEYSNRKIHMDEGLCDYWTAVMLNSPDIYDWHRADEKLTDKSNRNLSGSRTTADFIQDGDPHENGNIWSSALWDLRKAMGDGRKSDLLVMKMMVMFGQLSPDNPEKKRSIRNLKIEQKDELKDGLAMLLKADELLYKGKHHRLIIHTFAKLGIDLLTFDSAF